MKNKSFIIFTAFLFLLLIELISLISIKFLNLKFHNNDYIELTATKENCLFEQRILPHPTFSYTYDLRSHCAIEGLNKYGFNSQYAIEATNNPNFYDVLILGGSVAELSSLYKINGIQKLEYLLNKNYISPTGKPFRVHNTATGGNNYPTQLSILNYFIESIDAFIAIDGFNEFITINESGRIDMPPFKPFLYSFLLQYTDKIDELKFLYKYKKMAQQTILNHSSFFKLSYFGTRNFIFSSLEKFLNNMKLNEKAYHLHGKVPDLLDWNINRYEYYIKQYHALANTFNKNYQHILQPINKLFKEPIGKEIGYPVLFPSKNYVDLSKHIEMLEQKKYHTTTFISIFKDIKKEIYSDEVHYIIKDNYSLGYDIFFTNLLLKLEKNWKLIKK